jgi:hypothetical protein
MTSQLFEDIDEVSRITGLEDKIMAIANTLSREDLLALLSYSIHNAMSDYNDVAAVGNYLQSTGHNL